LPAFTWSKGRIVNELVNELMLIISTISSVLAGATALVSEVRMRRRDRIVSNASENVDAFQSVRNS
jgi:hypothetical protein